MTLGEGINELLERQHAGRQPFALVVGSVNGDPLVHHLLPLCVPGKIAGSLVGASPVADANVIVKTPKGFERYLPGNAHVTLGVEMHRTAIGHDLAAALRRGWIDDGPPIRIAEELQRHLIPPFVERLAPGGLRGRPLRVIRALEFMIARGILEQLVDGWRVIVDRRELDLDDTLVRAHLELWAKLQPCHPVRVDVDQVQARQRHGDLDALFRPPVAAIQQRRFASNLGQPVVRGH